MRSRSLASLCVFALATFACKQETAAGLKSEAGDSRRLAAQGEHKVVPDDFVGQSGPVVPPEAAEDLSGHETGPETTWAPTPVDGQGLHLDGGTYNATGKLTTYCDVSVKIFDVRSGNKTTVAEFLSSSVYQEQSLGDFVVDLGKDFVVDKAKGIAADFVGVGAVIDALDILDGAVYKKILDIGSAGLADCVGKAVSDEMKGARFSGSQWQGQREWAAEDNIKSFVSAAVRHFVIQGLINGAESVPRLYRASIGGQSINDPYLTWLAPSGTSSGTRPGYELYFSLRDRYSIQKK